MGILVLLVVVLVAVAVSLARTRRTEAFRAASVSPEAASALRRASGATRMRALAALVAGAIAFAVLVAVDDARPGAYGLPLLLAPGAAAVVGLGVFGAIPSVGIRTGVRSARRTASLAPRRPWSFGPPWAYLVPLTVAVSAAVFVVLAGLSSTATEDGLYRGIRVVHGEATSTSSPYPGWYYGVPLLVLTALLAAATLFALARIASAPAPAAAPVLATGPATGGTPSGTARANASSDALTEADRILRVASSRVVMKLSSGALLVYFGGALFFAGQATSNAATFWTGASATVVQPEGVIGVVEAIAGGVALILGATLLLLAALDAARAPVVVAGAGRTGRSIGPTAAASADGTGRGSGSAS